MLRSTLTALFIAILPLQAQSQPQESVFLNVCCLRYSGGIRSLLLKSEAGKDPEPVAIYQGGFTEPVPVLLEDGRLIVYKKNPLGNPAWINDWSIAVPSNTRSLSAVLVPSRPAAGPVAPYTPILLPPTSDFDYGSLFAINLTNLPVRMVLGAKNLTLASGASGIAPLKSEADDYNMVPVSAYIQHEEKWLALHSTRWPYNARCRQVAVIWLDTSAKLPEITTFREVLPRAQPEQ